MADVIAGIGVPGSGKTTFLKELAAKRGYAYISPDNIRAELSGSALDHSQNARAWDLTFERLDDALGRGQTAVLDATQAKSKDRSTFIEKARKGGAGQIIGIYFNVSLEEALKRNRARDRVVKEYAIERMHELLERTPPTIEEGFDEILTPEEAEAEL